MMLFSGSLTFFAAVIQTHIQTYNWHVFICFCDASAAASFVFFCFFSAWINRRMNDSLLRNVCDILSDTNSLIDFIDSGMHEKCVCESAYMIVLWYVCECKCEEENRTEQNRKNSCFKYVHMYDHDDASESRVPIWVEFVRLSHCLFLLFFFWNLRMG